MPFVGDIFGLNSVYENQVENVENRNFASWPESATYGYYAGGLLSGSTLSTITRLDFSNEIVNNPGTNLQPERRSFASVSSSFYGYFGGGTIPTALSTITRLDFSNETLSDPGKNFPTQRVGSAACSSSLYGYFGGGANPQAGPGVYLNTISRLDFSNETISDPGKNLPVETNDSAVVENVNYGYFGGSVIDPFIYSCTITRFDLSTETINSPGKNLPTNRSGLASVSSDTYGYFGGGGNPNMINTITRLDFSSETVSNPGRNLPSSRDGLAATSSSSFGYFGGGYSFPPAIFLNTITRLDFSSETVSNPGRNLPTGRRSLAGLSGGASVFRGVRGFGTYGYFGGGYSGTPNPPPFTKNLICRLDFSTDSFTPMPGLSGSARYNTSTFSDKNYGYFAGGQSTPGIIYTASATKISFPTETISATNPIGTARAGATGLSGKYCGYALGGGPSTLWRTGVKYDYSTESRVSTGSLTDDMFSDSGSVENLSYGFITGGTTTNCRRFEFSSETLTNTTNKLPTTIPGSAGISHNSYGYFFGGTVPGGTSRSTVIRLDFSGETMSLPGNNLPTARENITATQSASYGYLVGGQNPAAPPPTIYTETSAVNRFDFSTETISPIGNYPTTISDSGAVSNHNKFNF